MARSMMKPGVPLDDEGSDAFLPLPITCARHEDDEVGARDVETQILRPLMTQSSPSRTARGHPGRVFRRLAR